MESAEEDCEQIVRVIEDKKTLEETLLNILPNRTNKYRQEIREYYRKTYGEDLIDVLKKALSGDFKDAAVALFYQPLEFDCWQLRKAMKGAGTNEDTLIEIIATRPNWLMKKLVEKYSEVVKRNLEKDIESETSGIFKRLLISILQGQRSENIEPNLEDCAKWANDLYEAGEKKRGTDDSMFNKIFASKSPIEIFYIAKAYYKITKHTLIEAIDSEFSGDAKQLLKAILFAVVCPSEYFARKVKKSVKGAGTDDNMLIRVLVSRHEIDMKQINQYYRQLFKVSMIEDIKDDTSGNYQKLLVKLAEE